MDLEKRCVVQPGTKLRLKDFDPGETFGVVRDDDALQKSLKRLEELQQLLYADGRFALLIALQAMDAGGKDGTIRHVMSGVNPQGCQVTSFKAPTSEDLAHDFLWRIHQHVPKRGMIGIFNRSHYEDVLVVRVHDLVPEDVWSKRYKQINQFERILTRNSVKLLKFFLHISKDEQRKRFEQRLQDPERNWKLSVPDFKERQLWDDYQEAYEAALHKCSTSWAPWYIIPADKKWFRNQAISEILVHSLETMKLRYPPAAADLKDVTVE